MKDQDTTEMRASHYPQVDFYRKGRATTVMELSVNAPMGAAAEPTFTPTGAGKWCASKVMQGQGLVITLSLTHYSVLHRGHTWMHS